ncbi:MAG TPA: LuxR C-terminal-related transcriptional regulator [Streptomyces sp.]|jgi:DNA-directed RNA polymerase specialized sigma subunit|uniref:helix-turn-helix transcriptional regulator n=1 Tax=Streptomyces sp. TaxID=1931 RepID=UPI002B8A0C2C|nr:LuxR C-terminal-related transcriptional regulator [Streptomyces sp.]HWU09549.1 LuxR C-terminal-related transcriptional regulator [Streptomyces sp.]
MARYIEVTSDEVRAARIRVQALQSAGLEPDPTVVKIANAPRLSRKWVKELERLEQPTTIGGRPEVDQDLDSQIKRAPELDQELMAQLASFGPLTLRERQIIALRVGGATDKEIASRLSVSVATIQGHINRIAGHAKDADLQSWPPDGWMVKLAEAMHITDGVEIKMTREEAERNSE